MFRFNCVGRVNGFIDATAAVKRRRCGGIALPVAAAALTALLFPPTTASAGPWADNVVNYTPGSTAVVGYDNPATALGQPERVTGELAGFPGPVTMFNAPFGTDEIVSIGEGGSLTLTFDQPILDDPSHLYGVDLIVFGNTGFIDFGFPAGQQGDPALTFGNGNALVELSADGVNFFPVGNVGDALFPTQGYLDVGPFDALPGVMPTDFTIPMNPALTLADFAGLTYAQSLALYGGSAGGSPIDIASAGLASVSFVRISLADDGDAGTSLNAEIDAVSVVPEPATVALTLVGLVACARHRGRRSRRAGVAHEASRQVEFLSDPRP